MTVESTTNKAGPYIATGTGGTFPRPFLLRDEDHLRVIRVRDGVEADIVSVGHTGIGEASGEVVIGDGLEPGDRVYLLRDVPNLQTTDYTAQGRVRPDQVEADLDIVVMQLQDIAEKQVRAITVPLSSDRGGSELALDILAVPGLAQKAAAEAAAARDAAMAAAGGRNFATREGLAAAINGGQIVEGQMFAVRGVPAQRDAAYSGDRSALYDLGVDGVRLIGDVILSDWWLDGSTGDKSALIQAMNTYADANYPSGVAGCGLRLAGRIDLANQITLGTTRTGTSKTFSIDASAAVFNYIPGGNLASPDVTCGIIVRNCARSLIQFSQVLCNHIAGGIQVDRCTNSLFDGMDLNKFKTVGLWVRGNVSEDSPGTSAGSVFTKVTGTEWSNSEPEFQDSASYQAIGILNESHDVRFVAAHIGWCGLPIDNRAGSCEWDMCHPFNGNATGNGFRDGPMAFRNSGNSGVNIYNMYGDNGYIVDLTGGLNIDGLQMLDYNSRLEAPYVRVNSNPPALPHTVGQVTNCRTSLGFFDMSPQGNFDRQQEPIVILMMGQSNASGHPDSVDSQASLLIEPGVYQFTANTFTTREDLGWVPGQWNLIPFATGNGSGQPPNIAIAAANSLRRIMGREVYVICLAETGANIERFMKPATLSANGWSTDFNRWPQINAALSSALASVPGRARSHVDYFMWHQGEANGGNSAEGYADRFRALVADLVSANHVSNAGTVIVGGALRDGQAAAGMIASAWGDHILPNLTYGAFASASGLAHVGSTNHFTGLSLETFGKRYAWAAMRAPSNLRYSSDAMVSSKARIETSSKITRYITETGTPDDEWIKAGNASAEVVQRIWPGSGDPIALRYRQGRMTAVNHKTGLGDFRVSVNHRTGISSDGTEGALVFHAGDVEVGRFQGDRDFIPGFDGSQSMGEAGKRWSAIYAATGSINTSDENDKQDILSITDAVLDAWADVQFVSYRWWDAVAEKGEDARQHFGVVAQQIHEAFAARGIDAFRFGLLCRDEWIEEDGTPRERWGVRTDQCMVLEAALTRRTITRMAAAE